MLRQAQHDNRFLKAKQNNWQLTTQNPQLKTGADQLRQKAGRTSRPGAAGRAFQVLPKQRPLSAMAAKDEQPVVLSGCAQRPCAANKVVS